MPASMEEIQLVLTEATERLKGYESKFTEIVTEERVKTLAREMVNDLLTDPTGETATKLRAAWERTNPDPRLKGSKFAKFGMTAAHIEMAYDVLQAGKQAGMSRGPSEELVNAFNDVSKAYFIPQEEAHKQGMKALDGMWMRYHGTPNMWTQEAKAGYAAAVKAMDTAESGYGSQLIGAQYVGDLWPAARRLGRIFPLLDTFEMTSPTSYLPVEADLPEMTFVAENTSPTASAYTTVKAGSNRVQVDAKKFIIAMVWSDELEEDSIIPLIDYLMAQAQKSIAHYSDSLVLNGDTTNAATGNINLDDADPADTKHYLAFDGIRHGWLVDQTANGTDSAGALTLNKLYNLKGLMIDSTNLIDWGHPLDPKDLVYVADPQAADEIGKLSEVLTKEKYGDQATVFNGQVTQLLGHPVIASIASPKTEADGKVSTTAGNNTLGQVTAFNRRGYKVGWRRQVKVEVENLPIRGQKSIYFNLRLGFGMYSATGAASGREAGAGLYNITLNT